VFNTSFQNQLVRLGQDVAHHSPNARAPRPLFAIVRVVVSVVAMSRTQSPRDEPVEYDDTFPMHVSDDEAGGDVGTQVLRKVLVVNPFFAAKHLAPRAHHPDGTIDTKAQLTTLWVLGNPSPPKRRPRELNPPGIVLRRSPEPERLCSCLPAKRRPRHAGGAASDVGRMRGTVSSWGDESDSRGIGNDGSRAPVPEACVPGGGALFRKKTHSWSDDDVEVDPRSARIVKEQRDTRRPAPEPGAPHALPPPGPPGCFSGGVEDEEWSEDGKGRRRRRKKSGCLAGGDGEQNPETGRRKGGCLGSRRFGARDDGLSDEVDACGNVRKPRDGGSGCLAGYHEDGEWGTGASEDDSEDVKRSGQRPRPNRGCLAECLRVLCGLSESSRHRRRRRRRARETHRTEEVSRRSEGAAARIDRSRMNGPDDRADRDDRAARLNDSNDSNVSDVVSELDFRDDSDWAASALSKKPIGYSVVRVAALSSHTPPPRIALDFAQPSLAVLCLLGAFFSPALWRAFHRLSAPACRVEKITKKPHSPRREDESRIVECVARQTLPFLPDARVEVLGAVLGATFLAKASEASLASSARIAQTGVAEAQGEELFWLCGVFPQFLKAARAEHQRVARRRRAVIRLRRRAERRRGEETARETWESVVPSAAAEASEKGNAASRLDVSETKDDRECDGTKNGDDTKHTRGWNWSSLAMAFVDRSPSIGRSPADGESERRSPKDRRREDDAAVAFDPSVEKAVRAHMKRHRLMNKGQKLYWPGGEVPGADRGDGDARIAKPVGDSSAGDDADRPLGLGAGRMRRD